MRRILLSATALALVPTLSACGGGSTGGGVNSPGDFPAGPPPSNPTPPPSTPNPPPTTPTPPNPTPTPPPARSAEYQASGAVVGSRAGSAYDRNVTGDNVTIAVIDSGIDVDNPEFAGRITASSRVFQTTYASCMTCAPQQTNFQLDDVQGHGTWVASVAAGARNNSGSHGVAYDADIMALKISSPDLGSNGTIRGETGPNSMVIAPAIRYAVDNGAFVINLSMNGGTNSMTAGALREAMDHVRANNRLVVQSVSNDAGQNSFSGQIAEAMVGTDLANAPWFLFGIRVDPNNNAPSQNGNPGALAHRTLAVNGTNVLVAGLNNDQVRVSGNSFAAPAIAGAAALLKQYWPQLGGREISEILLTSATDLGAPGVDQVYGVGLLNVEQAMQAQAPSIKNSSVAATSITFSGPFAGAQGSSSFGAAAGQAVVLDRFGRDYGLNVGALANGTTPGAISIAHLAQPATTTYVPEASPVVNAMNLTSSPQQQRQLPTGAGQFGFRISPRTAITGAVNGSIENAETLTGSMFRSSGIANQGGSVNLLTGGHRFSLVTARSGDGEATSTTRGFSVELPDGLILGLTSNRENGSALGMRGTGAFGIEGARSTFATFGWTGEIDGVRLTGEAMVGRTKVATRDAVIEFADPVISSGFRFQAESGLFGGTASFGLTAPLRVERARMRYTLGTGYDLATRSLIEETRTVDLTPGARELDFELGWNRSFRNGYLGLGAAYGINAGNVRGQQSGALWLRYGARF